MSQINDDLYAFLISEGIPPGHINDMQYTWLLIQGIPPGQINDMWENYMSTCLLKTGQTTDSSVPGRTSQSDGATQIGRTREYFALITGQYSGTTNIVVNGKTDVHTNNCVRESVTGLMWNKDRAASVGVASNGLLFWSDTTNNEDIFEFCDQANLANLSGFSDWRVPNWLELGSLLEIETGPPYLDASFFPNIGAAIAWSSNDAANNAANGIVINFNAGIPTAQVKLTTSNSCMLVRG